MNRSYVESQARVAVAVALSNAIRDSGMSQRRVAELMQVSQGAVSRWCTGAASPDIGVLAVLARYLGVSVGALVAGIDGMGGRDAR